MTREEMDRRTELADKLDRGDPRAIRLAFELGLDPSEWSDTLRADVQKARLAALKERGDAQG